MYVQFYDDHFINLTFRSVAKKVHDRKRNNVSDGLSFLLLLENNAGRAHCSYFCECVLVSESCGITFRRIEHQHQKMYSSETNRKFPRVMY